MGEERIFGGLKFPFCLKPVVQFATRCSTPRQIDFVGALPDLFQSEWQPKHLNGWCALILFGGFSF